MAKLILLISLNLIGQSLASQEFQLPIYFEDSAANRDSITIGYDDSATVNIDPAFGEKNMLGNPYSNNLDVRVCLYNYKDVRYEDARLLESKKMFIKKPCTDKTYFDEAHSFMVVIRSNHWPIIMRWDNSLISDTCEQITIVDCTPGGWLHICGPGHPYRTFEMANNSSATYDSSEYSVPGTGDSLKALFFAFNVYRRTADQSQERDEVNIFPNPSNGQFSVITSDIVSNAELHLYNIAGEKVLQADIHQKVDVSHLMSGIYYYKIKNLTGVTYSGKLSIRK